MTHPSLLRSRFLANGDRALLLKVYDRFIAAAESEFAEIKKQYDSFNAGHPDDVSNEALTFSQNLGDEWDGCADLVDALKHEREAVCQAIAGSGEVRP